jgi:hypothetical protein
MDTSIKIVLQSKNEVSLLQPADHSLRLLMHPAQDCCIFSSNVKVLFFDDKNCASGQK